MSDEKTMLSLAAISVTASRLTLPSSLERIAAEPLFRDAESALPWSAPVGRRSGAVHSRHPPKRLYDRLGRSRPAAAPARCGRHAGRLHPGHPSDAPHLPASLRPDHPNHRDHTSRFLTSRALSWMNSRRGSTMSPIKVEKISSACSAWLIFTCRRARAFGSRVVSQS